MKPRKPKARSVVTDETRRIRARFYAQQRGENLSEQEKAQQAPQEQTEQAQTVIPDDWESMQRRKKVKLAEQISGTKIEVDSNAKDTAEAIIKEAAQAGAK